MTKTLQVLSALTPYKHAIVQKKISTITVWFKAEITGQLKEKTKQKGSNAIHYLQQR